MSWFLGSFHGLSFGRFGAMRALGAALGLAIVGALSLAWHVGVFTGNRHVVAADRVYRSAQLPPDELRAFLSEHEIRRVLIAHNLVRMHMGAAAAKESLAPHRLSYTDSLVRLRDLQRRMADAPARRLPGPRRRPRRHRHARPATPKDQMLPRVVKAEPLPLPDPETRSCRLSHRHWGRSSSIRRRQRNKGVVDVCFGVDSGTKGS